MRNPANFGWEYWQEARRVCVTSLTIWQRNNKLREPKQQSFKANGGNSERKDKNR